jgi:hypothetical protein
MSALLKVALMSGGTVALRSGGTCDSGTKVAASGHISHFLPSIQKI